ncbi:MAG TPA: hypothetical protein VNO43_17415 [Candidatus Eisenbacteria bacterium]|nr:hypothetical protein [Candidatus Eisenbacteria bacterium]
MAESVKLLMLEFLRWVAARPRSYAEAMTAWQSTCPRHTIWEDAIIEGLIELGARGEEREVTLTARGKGLLEPAGPTAESSVQRTKAAS